MIKGKKVLLRPPRLEDAPLFVGWIHDPKIRPCLGDWADNITLEGEQEWIRGLPSDEKTAVFVVEVDGRTIGNGAIHDINREKGWGGLGVIIGEKDCWSKGYGTEVTNLLLAYAFCQLGLRLVESVTFEFNEKAVKALRRCGYREVGRIKRARMSDGEWFDRIIFHITKKEWAASNKGLVVQTG